MIDLTQWRASIGLWNYCQTTSSRPANGRQCHLFKEDNGRHCHSFKGAVNSKSNNAKSEEKTIKLPAALPIFTFLLLLHFCFPSRFDDIPPTGKANIVVMCIITSTSLLLDIIAYCHWSQVQCNTDMYSLQSIAFPADTTINLILFSIVRLLLLLSGDVELNPGPTVGDG